MTSEEEKKKGSLYRDVGHLLKRVGWNDSDSYRIIGMEGGRNNDVFRIEGSHENVVCKRFYKKDESSNSRLYAEFQFAQFLWNKGIHCIARPLCFDRDRNIAAYDFVRGRPFTSEDVNEENISKAIEFFKAMNYPGVYGDASHLPSAKESCFSLLDHVRCINRRIEVLKKQGGGGQVDFAFHHFSQARLPDLWKKAITVFKKKVLDYQLSLDTKLSRSHWCLSPSDFGFHNAIIGPTGEIKFLDFEYAGWDDPAKVVCDFFCQVEHKIPDKYFPMTSKGMLEVFPDFESNLKRVEVLMPLYRLKWCTIVLNEFLPEVESKRKFAGVAGTSKQRKKEQMDKAQRIANQMEKDLKEF